MAYAAQRIPFIGENYTQSGGASVDPATIAAIWAATVGNKYISPLTQAQADEFQALTYAASMTWTPSSQGYNISVLLGGNLNLILAGPYKLGRYYTLLMNSNTGGSKTFAYDNTIIDMGGQTITLSTAADKSDMLRLQCVSTAGSGKFKGSFIKAG